MKFDGELDIAIGMSADSVAWKNKKIQWSWLVQRLSDVIKTSETFKEYMSSSKEDQDRIKDVGGYVGGYLRNGRRKKGSVLHRQILTLDIDFAHLDFWEDFILQFENAGVLHSTHKHHDASPRFRLVLPLSREVTPEEYSAISRKVAELLNIDLFDSTTFDTNRLMFWPSIPKDMDYYFRFQDGKWIDPDEILNMYVDWKDTSSWAMNESHLNRIKTATDKQEDPENKKGLIGAFCRTYSITEAISKYLSDVYVKGADGRYTYTQGSTSSGLVIYDDKFAYSHHDSDPCSGKLCNAFDLIRIHKFGHLDGKDTESSKSKSFKSMEDFIRNDKEVKKIIASESISEAKYDFSLATIEDTSYEQLEDENIDWVQDLEIDARGKYVSSANNVNLIFANDIRLKGLFRRNRFDNKNYVFGNLPWRRVPKPEPILNVDYSGVRNYVETIYGISGTLKIDDVMNLEMEKNSYHPIHEYLRSLEWDGKNRIDTLLIDYFGAEDNVYTREAMRKQLVGAVARIFKPGVDFQYALIIVGPQGCGKSTFIKKLGKSWFSDTFYTVQGKEALEQLQGAWIIEMAELAGLRKAEVEAVKHFISKSDDSFRPAYARTPETYMRQCVFFGTTNTNMFLKDSSGNRRFNPVDVVQARATKSVFDDLDEYEVDQIWAEALYLYKKGERLTLSYEANQIATVEQRLHSEVDERSGIIIKYLDTPITEDWDKKDIFERRQYYEDNLSAKGNVVRDYVCVAEIWCECLGKNREDMDRYKTREINEILRTLEDWEQSKSTMNFKHYGKQKYYSRRLD